MIILKLWTCYFTPWHQCSAWICHCFEDGHHFTVLTKSCVSAVPVCLYLLYFLMCIGICSNLLYLFISDVLFSVCIYLLYCIFFYDQFCEPVSVLFCIINISGAGRHDTICINISECIHLNGINKWSYDLCCTEALHIYIT